MLVRELKAAISALAPWLTWRNTDGEFRVSVNVQFLRQVYGYSHADAMERNESLAAYVDSAEEALSAAEHLKEYINAEIRRELMKG